MVEQPKRTKNENSLKVCIFTETYFPVMGGGETQARLLAEGLIAGGHSVIILTRRSDSTLPEVEHYGGITVYRLPPVGGGQLKKWGLIFSGFLALIWLREKYDLIFVSGYRIIGTSAVLVARLFNKRCVLKADSQGEMSGDFFENGLKKFGLSRSWLPFRIFLWIRNYFLIHANAFTAISTDIKTEYLSVGVSKASIFNIPNCVDTSRFFPTTQEEKIRLRNKLEIPLDSIVVIYTGRLVTYKGLPFLLEVWKDIQGEIGNIKLFLVGTGGLDIHNCEQDLKKFVKMNFLENSVHFTGNISNVPDYLKASDIFVFPTEDDALPSSLLEAMACGLPVISTPVGAIKTIIKDGENGLIVAPGNFQQLKEALISLFGNPSLSARLGISASTTVQLQYSSEIVTKKYLSLFLKIAVKYPEI